VKPVAFEYDDPRTVEEVLDLLAEHGDEAKLLAGGQSLVPLLNFRIVRPARVIDLNGVAELAGVREEDGTLRIGALTRVRELEAGGQPLVADALRHAGHPQIRSRGTAGGAVAHADPASELPAVLLALDASFSIRSARGGERTVAARDMFVGPFTTQLAPHELLVEIAVPPLPPRTGAGFAEAAPAHGAFATAGVAATLTLDEDGTCAQATLAVLAATATPVRLGGAEASLVGRRPDEAIDDAAAVAAREIEPMANERIGGDYLRALVAELTRRALREAAA
jgi:CO/xanthine dehydrogenase FAD-binding subunit